MRPYPEVSPVMGSLQRAPSDDSHVSGVVGGVIVRGRLGHRSVPHRWYLYHHIEELVICLRPSADLHGRDLLSAARRAPHTAYRHAPVFASRTCYVVGLRLTGALRLWFQVFVCCVSLVRLYCVWCATCSDILLKPFKSRLAFGALSSGESRTKRLQHMWNLTASVSCGLSWRRHWAVVPGLVPPRSLPTALSSAT